MNAETLELFLAACGSSEPLRLGVGQRDQLSPEARSFRQPFLVIGRRPESDLVLDHWQVSKRHAYLQLIEGRYFCVDLGSRTGTHGGDSAERSGWLEPDRPIQIGPFTVLPEMPSVGPKTSDFSPSVTWELPGRALGQSLWRMDRHMALIGRSPACKIRIVEPDVSKFHASIVLTPMGVWVVDLLGQNGILVNGQPVRYARMEDGAELRIGRHLLRARYNSPPLPLPRPRPTMPETSDHPGSLARVEPTFLARFPRPLDPALPARLGSPTSHDLAAIQGSGGPIDPSVNLLVHQFGMMQQQMFDQFHQTMMMMFEGFAAIHREQANSIREEFEQVRQLSEEIESLRRETARLADEAARSNSPRPRSSAGPGHFSSGRSTGEERPPALRPPDPTIKRANIPEPDPQTDIHSQLLLRLSTMQNERQTRWQKILNMMSSKP